MATYVAKSASRALGLVKYTSKLNGGFPYECLSKLYDSLVWPLIDYGSCIWGTNRRSCIEAVQTRACRYVTAVGKYTPNIAVQGNMGWYHYKLEVGNPWGDAGQGLKIRMKID